MDLTFGEDGNGDLGDLGLEVELEDVADVTKAVKKGIKRARKLQAVTMPERRPSRAGYSENYRADVVFRTTVFFIVYAIGSAVCGAIGFTLGLPTIYAYQIIAFCQSGFYLVTALYGLGTICRPACMIMCFFTSCSISAVASLGVIGYYCYTIYLFATAGIFDNCQEVCSFIGIPVLVMAGLTVMAFISALLGCIYCFK